VIELTVPEPSADPMTELAQLRRQLQRQETVLEITRSFASATTLDALLLRVGEQTCVAVNADRATMFLVDEKTQTLWSKAASALEIREIRIPLGIGLAGYVAQTGAILNIPNAYEDPIWSTGRGPEIDRQTGYLSRSLLVMPVKSGGGKIIGVFQILNKKQPGGTLPPPGATVWPVFTDEDVEFMQSIGASAAIAVQNAYLIEQTKDMFASTVQVLATTMDRRNPETAGHSQRVALSAAILAQRMGLSAQEIEKIRYAGLLHDVGKVGIRDEILMKPGRFTDEEYLQIKRHALFTRQILDEVHFLDGYEDIPRIAGQHHERLDGSGYPFGDRGEAITLGGRLLAVADIFDALRGRRVYKPPMPIAQSIGILHEEVLKGFLDATAVSLLEQCLEEIEATCGPLRPGYDEEEQPVAAQAQAAQ
jgi:GAF domain-containing protein